MGKLARDRTPSIIEGEGQVPEIRTLDATE